MSVLAKTLGLMKMDLSPNMSTFYLNNSSLPWLTCAKQYHLRVVLGLQPPPGGNKYTAGGLAFHKMMQLVGTEAIPNITSAVLFNRANLHDKIKSIPEPLALQYAQLAQQIYDEHPEMFSAGHRRELHFEYQCSDDTQLDGEIGATRTGTIDLLTLSPDGFVDITDYKTTSKPIDGGLLSSYKLSSQRHFYTLALYYLDLPEAFKSAIAEHRIRFRYCFVNAEKNQYYLQPPALVDINELQVFARLFNEKALYAAAIHADPTLAVKEGILNNSCWKCPFTSICLADDESSMIASWPYGTKTYNPNHQDE